MRLQLCLPAVQPATNAHPTVCPYPGCGGRSLRRREETGKPLRDTRLDEVVARRYVCRRCGRRFRVYPSGVNHAHTSARLRGVAVALYLMGLSYGTTARVLASLGVPLSKTAVYNAVRDLGKQATVIRRPAVRPPAAVDVATPTCVPRASVTCEGQQLQVEVGVDAAAGLAVTIQLRDEQAAPHLTAWLQEVAGLVGAELRRVG